MKLKNAIKKLSKFGKVENSGSLYFARVGNHFVEFMSNGKIEEAFDICCIRVRACNDEDDTMTDYFAGVWCDNLTQAIRIANG